MWTFDWNVANCTHVDVVVHDGDVIEGSSQVRNIGHGFTIRTKERGD